MEDEEFERLWHSLVDRHHRKAGKPLNEDELGLYALNFFAGSVPRSGMVGYFESSTLHEISAAKAALGALGLDSHVRILCDAQRILMGGSAPAADDVQIQILPRHLSQSDYDSASEAIERQIAPVENHFESLEDDLYDGIAKYIDSRDIRTPEGY